MDKTQQCGRLDKTWVGKNEDGESASKELSREVSPTPGKMYLDIYNNLQQEKEGNTFCANNLQKFHMSDDRQDRNSFVRATVRLYVGAQ